MPAITVANLSKTYRYHRKAPGLRGSIAGLLRRETLETHAVADISFQIEASEVVGFLGPNGAGKTTTLKMLCGLLYPDGGQADVAGRVLRLGRVVDLSVEVVPVEEIIRVVVTPLISLLVWLTVSEQGSPCPTTAGSS